MNSEWKQVGSCEGLPCPHCWFIAIENRSAVGMCGLCTAYGAPAGMFHFSELKKTELIQTCVHLRVFSDCGSQFFDNYIRDLHRTIDIRDDLETHAMIKSELKNRGSA